MSTAVIMLILLGIIYFSINRKQMAMDLRIRKYTRAGVNFIDPKRIYIEKNVRIGKNTIIYPNVYLYSETIVGQNCTIWPGANIFKTSIGDNCTIWPNVSVYDARIGAHTTIHSHNRIVSSFIYEYSKIDSHCLIKYSEIGSSCKVGPHAYIHNYSTLEDNSEVANIEIVRSTIGKETKAKHGRYIGDAIIGKNCNIGAETVFCNYDGVNKNKSVVGNDVFIGSGTMIIAPIKIRDRAIIAAGSIVSQDIDEKDFIIERGHIHTHHPDSGKGGGRITKKDRARKNNDGWHFK